MFRNLHFSFGKQAIKPSFAVECQADCLRYRDCESPATKNCIIHVIFSHTKKKSIMEEQEEEERKPEKHLKRELHAIVKQEHETGWVRFLFCGKFRFSLSPSHRTCYMLCHRFRRDRYFVDFLCPALTGCRLNSTQNPEGQGRKLRVTSRCRRRRRFGRARACLCWYVQK